MRNDDHYTYIPASPTGYWECNFCGHRNGGATNAAQHVAECHAYEIKYGDDDE